MAQPAVEVGNSTRLTVKITKKGELVPPTSLANQVGKATRRQLRLKDPISVNFPGFSGFEGFLVANGGQPSFDVEVALSTDIRVEDTWLQGTAQE